MFIIVKVVRLGCVGRRGISLLLGGLVVVFILWQLSFLWFIGRNEGTMRSGMSILDQEDDQLTFIRILLTLNYQI